MRAGHGRHAFAVLAVGLIAVATTSGCAMVYQAVKGDGPMQPARFEGLEKKRVAVVCVTSRSDYSSESSAGQIANIVGKALRNNIDTIDLVRQSEVDDWIDNNNWNESDFFDVGKGVRADVVVAITVNDMTLHDGQTLYKGRADFDVRVYDILNVEDKILFDYTDPSFEFPESHGIPTTDRSEGDFRRLFIQELSANIARNFYSYRMAEEFAKDAAAYTH